MYLLCAAVTRVLVLRYSRAYDLALSVAKWAQSSGDGVDQQEEVKRQKRCVPKPATFSLPLLFSLLPP